MAPLHPSTYTNSTESKQYLDSWQEEYFTARFFLCNPLLSGFRLSNKKLIPLLIRHAVGGGKTSAGDVCFGVPVVEVQSSDPTYLCYEYSHRRLDAFKNTGTYVYEASFFPFYGPNALVDITGTNFHGIWWRAVSKFFVVHNGRVQFDYEVKSNLLFKVADDEVTSMEGLSADWVVRLLEHRKRYDNNYADLFSQVQVNVILCSSRSVVAMAAGITYMPTTMGGCDDSDDSSASSPSSKHLPSSTDVKNKSSE
ncbi:hypothetical protein ACA910_003782 [Epithemia clementina (nom. ined.)]